MVSRIGKYVIATRPWSFSMSLISVSVGTLLASQAGPISWTWYLLTAAGITLFHAAANVINDYFDTRYQIDQEDSPTTKYRPQPIISGMLTPRQLLGEAVVLFGLTFIVGMAASIILSWHILWIGFVGFLVSVYYTAGPVKFKYRALGELAVFVIWGPLMVEGAYAVQRQDLSGKALAIAIPFGLLVSLVLFANNMRDRAYDSRQNVKTLATMLGPDRSLVLFAGLIVLAYASVLVMILVGIMGLWGLVIFLSVPAAIRLVKTFQREIPDMADALTAKFDTLFGILLIMAMFLEARIGR